MNLKPYQTQGVTAHGRTSHIETAEGVVTEISPEKYVFIHPYKSEFIGNDHPTKTMGLQAISLQTKNGPVAMNISNDIQVQVGETVRCITFTPIPYFGGYPTIIKRSNGRIEMVNVNVVNQYNQIIAPNFFTFYNLLVKHETFHHAPSVGSTFAGLLLIVSIVWGILASPLAFLAVPFLIGAIWTCAGPNRRIAKILSSIKDEIKKQSKDFNRTLAELLNSPIS